MRTCICLAILFCSSIVAGADDRAGDQFFETKIRPVLVKHCYECHSTESGKSRGGLKVDTRDALRRGGESGPAIRGRSALDSLLYQSITYDGDYQMPPKGKLPDQVIADIRRWIEMGAPDPRVTKNVPDVKSEIDVAAGRNFWAYQLPKLVRPPTVTNASWPRNDLDRFVLARLESEDLQPVADAEAGVLVRRLFFVLTGLPPTPAAIEHWSAEIEGDSTGLNQAAIEKLVDTLLGSKYFGERWGRHWLDVARFAESTGGDSNNVHQHAWRYRDYVIDSFNNDKPFNRFIMEQVAGDLLPIGSDAEWAENIIATGFLAVGQKLVGEEDAQKFYADLVDEQIDATTRAFLATTVACARCHDHKADPIPQSDYYALAGIFRATETHYGLIKAQTRQATTLIDITGLGPEPGIPALTADEYAELVKARDDARQTVDDAMKKIRSGENVFRGTLRRIRSDRDETEATLQAYDSRGNPRVFAMGTQDRNFPLPTRLLLRGEIDKPAQLVPRGFVQVLSKPGRHSLPPRINGSGRLELAEWIASEQNPLTARVIVSRVWYWMFGQGLVRTADDFGASGERPSHPQLLDHLAARFMENGWSIKSLIREIAMSRTWQLSSDFDAANFDIDPDNRLLWRTNKRQLEAESIRDAMLFAAGNLDPERPLGTYLRSVGEGTVGQNVFEPVIRAIESNHRSVYLPRVRSVMPEMLELFDAPDAGSVSGTRESTSSPLQALYMLNNEFVASQAESLADRLLNQPASQRVDSAYLLLLGRRSTPAERQHAFAFMDSLNDSSRLDKRDKLLAYCQVLMCTTEFSQID
ncbi:PSD1 and planctomycete cytochrome C domain-containing protein [Crateriforma spongiae]|uniref:PSD1 and planctomycete cytochrome C domain-containing protein n=1 Tax=Crateriforma spongiae TaxID=2724528 RepID=UPI0014468E4C|nr:PSD1 and planctomycete cytochrome C domain-containing protein [Crateriforma spongiae]